MTGNTFASSPGIEPAPAECCGTSSARSRKISAGKTAMFYEHQIGETQEVLFEQAQDGYWTGYTGNYTRAVAMSGDDLTNDMRRVVLEEHRAHVVLQRNTQYHQERRKDL